MKLLTTFLALTIAFAPTILCGQQDTSEWRDVDGRYIFYCKVNSFKSRLIVIDSAMKDTLEIVKQISKNRCVSILYERNKPKYKVYCKAYYNKEARKTRREERHHDFVHRLPRKLRGNHKTCFFPTFYYGKSAKIKRRFIFSNGSWKMYKNKNIKAIHALFENYTVDINRRAKF